MVRSVECWTDHKLLKAKLMLRGPPKLMLRGPPKPKKPVKRKRFAVSRLSDEKTREQYRKCVEEAVSGEWCSEAGGNRKWELFRDGSRSSAEKCLGWENRRQPDWFKDNFEDLQKLIMNHNLLFAKWLSTGYHSDRQRYVSQRRAVAHEVRHAKNTWFQQKAQQVEIAMRGGKGVWNGLWDIQRGRAGLRPVKPKAIRNSSGEICMGPESSLHRWHEHFETVLNTRSNFEESVIQSAEQRPVRKDLAQPPAEDEVMEALGKLKGNKAGGKTGILLERC